jgi:TDG/mug DNA glycosylase family protein
VVFIGYNPAIYSAEAGHYYARPGNVFWRQLSASGLAGRTVGPDDDCRLMDEAGIGFVDLCCRPTVRAEELLPEEIRAGARRLHEELLAARPLVAVFSGRGIYQHYGRHALGLRPAELAGRDFGEQVETFPPAGIGEHRTKLWVVPSSSGLASKYHRERMAWMEALVRALDARAVDISGR